MSEFEKWVERELPRATGYERDLCLTAWLGASESMEELWKAIKDMEPTLGDANKPLAIAASYALLKMKNEELAKERDAALSAPPQGEEETTYTIIDEAIKLLDAHDCKAAVKSLHASKKYIANVPVSRKEF